MEQADTPADALAELVEEHERMADLVGRLEQVPDGTDAGVAAGLVREITNQLNAHAALEEEVLYPAVLERAPELKPLVEEAIGAHEAAKDLLFGASVEAAGGGASAASAAPLAEALDRHGLDDELVDSLRTAVAGEEVAAVAREVGARREELAAGAEEGRAQKQQEQDGMGGVVPRLGTVDVEPPAAHVRNQ